MKRIGVITSAALSILLGIALPTYAQDEKRDQPEEKPAQREKPGPQETKKTHDAKPAPGEKQRPQQQSRDQKQQHPQQKRQEQDSQQHARQPQQDQNNQQHAQQDRNNQQHARQQAGRPEQQQSARSQNSRPQRSQQQQQVQQSAFREHRAQNWQSDHRNWQQRGGYNGYRIPDDRFRGYFGSQHGFRMDGLPFLVVGGYPRFQYEGYWFSLVDPWPGEWADDWYDTDDVYVAYVNNGYYLFDRRYPNIAIAVNVSM